MKYFYHAMTEAELQGERPLPERIAYMACHFSPYGTGLSNFPRTLPEGSLLMLNDRTPVSGHDPELVAGQLREAAERFQAEAVVLDFQRGVNGVCRRVAELCADSLPCPVAVTEDYAEFTEGPVVLAPPELWTALGEWCRPWEGREIWAEAVLQRARVTVTEAGSRYEELCWEEPPEGLRMDEALKVRYCIRQREDGLMAELYRGPEELKAWMEEAEKLGVSRFLGLYQQVSSIGTLWGRLTAEGRLYVV